jgi:hypothetical protein
MFFIRVVDKDGLFVLVFRQSALKSHIEALLVYRTFVHGTIYDGFLFGELSDFNWAYAKQVKVFFGNKKEADCPPKKCRQGSMSLPLYAFKYPPFWLEVERMFI